MTRENQDHIIEDINLSLQHHWTNQWASDMQTREEESTPSEEDYAFRNDWDEWYWGD